MTPVQTLSLVLLACCLIVAVWRRVNIGTLALTACLILEVASGFDVKEMYTSFPGSLLTLIIGVSLLFGHLKESGAITAVVRWMFRRVQDRVLLLPWVGFVLAASLSSIGAFSTAPIALLVPVVSHISTRYRPWFFCNTLAVIIGANMAGLSPLNPTGATVATALGKAGMHYSTWGLWAVSVVTAIVVVAGLQAFTALRLRGGVEPVVVPHHLDSDVDTAPVARLGYAWASSIALAVFVLAVTIWHLDVGLTSIALAVVLQLIFRPSEKALIHSVPWSAVLLLGGLLTFLGFVQKLGTMDAIQAALIQNVPPALMVLTLAYLAALLCNVESSALGVLTLMAPVVGATLAGAPNALWIIAAVAVPASLTVMNPVHVAGTLIIANTQEDRQSAALTRLLGLSVGLSLVAPGLFSGLAAVLG